MSLTFPPFGRMLPTRRIGQRFLRLSFSPGFRQYIPKIYVAREDRLLKPLHTAIERREYWCLLCTNGSHLPWFTSSNSQATC